MTDPAHSTVQSSQPDRFFPEAYIQQALRLLALNVPPDQLANVVENFDRIRTIAQPVLDFPLPDNLEAAPQFEPE